MSATTILFYSANQKPEPFFSRIISQLKEAASDLPIISITHKPLDLGKNIVISDYAPSTWTLYKQILIGAKAAETKYVACAEDDCLYIPEHYQWRPPRDGTFYYNRNRWWIEEHDKKIRYRWRKRTVMSTCIVNRELMIETLETRFAKYPEPLSREKLTGWAEPGRLETYLKLPQVKIDFFSTQHPLVTFNTKPSLGGLRRANPSDMTCEYLEPWGRANLLWGENT